MVRELVGSGTQNGVPEPLVLHKSRKIDPPVLPIQVEKKFQEICPICKILRRREWRYQKNLKTPESRDKSKKRKSRKLPGQI